MKINSAYTLIELLVSISIVSIIFLIGYANFRDFSKRQALTGVNKKVITDLRLIQQKAFSGEKPAGCTTLDGYQFKVISPDSYTLEALCPTPKEGDIIDLSSYGVSISVNNNPIIFKVLGQGTNLENTANIEIYSSLLDKKSYIDIGIGGDIKAR